MVNYKYLTIGIGAYLVRLGQRTIQVEGAPIILTGANALNKVYGREVYTSNLQLGGTGIMSNNGITHLVAKNDLDGVLHTLKWLSFVPKLRNSPLPLHLTADISDRAIDVEIPAGSYDPRSLIAGHEDSDGKWKAGFFDRNSFIETLAGWAKGVVVGRATLMGHPMGVIATESRSTEQTDFVDPSVETSQEHSTTQAGQVWYPNSAFKTAQAIRDFNYGEQLPLIIFANWRGFAGGQSEMHKEVLKYGADIVDALVDFKQPVFIYNIGELRGGAWVVLDPTINPEMMELYVSEDARGGVLEPPGVVEIKFRRPKIINAMNRLNKEYEELRLETRNNPSAQDEFLALEKKLFPVFTHAALSFADLHDRPGNIKA